MGVSELKKKTITKHYMQAFYPGPFFSETKTIHVETREPPKLPPKGAYAVQFFDREEAFSEDGEILKGKAKNQSPTYYWGEWYSLDRIKAEFAHDKILINNVECNGFDGAVKMRGHWKTILKDDVVMDGV